ncbi:MAG TPA: DUF4147 domain-containing protein, partial [Anaerolineae bacterium]|nr:DUF4147 domain-containing protein [Anaerolineae bacterium]
MPLTPNDLFPLIQHLTNTAHHAAHPQTLLSQQLHYHPPHLSIGTHQYNLNHQNLHILAIGKAALSSATALHHLLTTSSPPPLHTA